MTGGVSVADDEDAGLVEEPDGEGDDGHGEHVGGGGDDGCEDEDEDDGVAAEAHHEGGGEDAEFGQEPAEHGELEDEAEREAHGEEGGDVGLEGDEVGDVGGDLVGGQESEGEGEEEEVGEEYAEEEHEVAPAHDSGGVAPFVGVEGGGDEAEEEVEGVGGGEEEADVDGGFEVDDELLGQAGVDELDGEGSGGISREPVVYLLQESVGDEVALPGGEEDGKDFFLAEEGDQSAGDGDDKDPDEGGSQYVEVVPEGHDAVVSLWVRHRVAVRSVFSCRRRRAQCHSCRP